MKGAAKNISAFIVGLAALGSATLPAWADFDQTTLRVAARVLSFMEKPPAGTVTAGIVYAPDNPRSAADAARLQSLLDAGLQAGNVTLQAKMVKIADAGSANVGLFLLAEGAGNAAGRLADVARRKDIPCITTDLAQVRNGNCAIGVSATPRVDIIVNRAAADASQVRFSTAFRMLVSEF